MNVIDAINSRSTVRAFKPDPLDKGTILRILEAATRAPSWGNSQPWELFVAGGDALERLREGYAVRMKHKEQRTLDIPAPRTWPPAVQEHMRSLLSVLARPADTTRSKDEMQHAFLASNYRFFGAPVVVFLCMDRSLASWSMFDMGALALNVMLAAQEYGVDSAIAINFAAFPDLVRAELDIPEHFAVLIGIALGLADATQPHPRTPRRPLNDIVRCAGI